MAVINKLENYLDFCAANNKIISKNIANVGTKNYKREEVSFENILENEKSTIALKDNPKFMELPSAKSHPFKIDVDNNKDAVSGINNVDIEREMAELAENTIKFKFTSKKISNYYSSIRSAIKGGGGQR